MKSSNGRMHLSARRAAGLFFLSAVAATAQSYSITPVAPILQFQSIASGLNGQGQVVGECQESSGHWHAFIFNGQFIDIGTLGGDNSESLATNASGDVVGTSEMLSGMVSHAFLYRSGQLYDLNALIAPQSGWVLTSAKSITDAGQIVGDGLNGGQKDTFILSPASIATCSPPEQPVCFAIAAWRGSTPGSGPLLSQTSGQSYRSVALSANTQRQSVGTQEQN